jgi:hypothetical protein
MNPRAAIWPTPGSGSGSKDNNAINLRPARQRVLTAGNSGLGFLKANGRRRDPRYYQAATFPSYCTSTQHHADPKDHGCSAIGSAWSSVGWLAGLSVGAFSELDAFQIEPPMGQLIPRSRDNLAAIETAERTGQPELVATDSPVSEAVAEGPPVGATLFWSILDGGCYQ